MHVVLSGYYGFDNVGDEAILFSIIQALRDVEPDVNITVLSNNPAHTMETYGVMAANRWNLSEISQVLKASDGLISGGGSLLQDKTGMKSIPYYTGVMRIARRHKKPVFIYSQGMGPINHWISKWLVRSALKKAAGITLRDKDSAQLLRDIGVRSDVKVVPDPVLGLDGQAFEQHLLQKDTGGENFIAVSVRDWSNETTYKEEVAGCLDDLIHRGYAIVFVPMHGEHDRVSSEEMAGMMVEESTIFPADASIEEKIAVIGDSELLIGMRLHAMIFAAVTFTPFVGLSYDPKIDSFAAICDQPVAGNVNEDDWGRDTLFRIAMDSLGRQDELEDMLKEKISSLRDEAKQTAVLALDALKKG